MKRFTSLALMILLSFTLVACGASGTDNDAETAEDEIVEITVQLSWTHNPQFVGFYLADRNGYYQEEGLNVVLNPSGPGQPSVVSILDDGGADLIIGEGQEVIQNSIDGKGYIALGATYQQNPLVFLALRDEDGNDPMQTADDWRGQRISYGEGDLKMFGVLSTFGLTFDDVEHVPDTFTVAPLIDGDIKVLNAFITDRGRTLSEQGFDVQIMHSEDYGVLTYQEVIVTTSEYIEANPDVVEGFMRATLRGWQYAIENRDEAISAVVAFDSSQSPEAMGAIWDATLPLLGDSETLLEMDEAVFESTQNLMLELGFITETRDASSYFTNEYLQSE